MIKDERISKAHNRIAATGFAIMTILLSISIMYRAFYLRQQAAEYWDISLIYFIGIMYVSIASFSRGAVHESTVARQGKRIIPIVLIVIVAVNYFLGNINNAADFFGVTLGTLIGVSMIGFLSFYLYRQWERRNELHN